MTTPAEALAHVLQAYADAPDDRLMIEATTGIHGPGVRTGLTMGDLRALADQQTPDPCANSGRTVSRWYAPHGWDTPAADIPDPGPYADGEHVTCPLCRRDVPVTPHATTERETGTQYVARYTDH
ncbi:hypothetical protein ACH4S8_37965 [Streptomyces sp. NPDC021080]|uniref:hypothetical protein n=1 Tax=Streptomyces sp. NPDC021080 TaxID=3365110 RepID=UPI003798F496